MAEFANLSGATFLVLVTASVLVLIGLSTPYWFTGNYENEDINGGFFVICTPKKCISLIADGYLKATQSFEILGFILLIVSTILMTLYFFSESRRTSRYALNIVIWTFIAGIVIILGVIIFGTNVEKRFTLGWSFGFAVVGGTLSLVGGVLATINYKRSATSG